MRVFILLLFAGAIAGLAAEALPPGAAAANDSRPLLTFTTTEVDFGKVVSGNEVRHDFEFTNDGTEAVQIADVEFGCDCSVAATWDKAIQPGERGRIAVTMNTDTLNGDVIKTITIRYAKPRKTQTGLRFKGNVWPAIEIAPRFATLGSIRKADDPASTTLKIHSNLEQALAITKVSCENAAFRAELREVNAGRDFELTITARPPLVPGLNEGLVVLETSYAKRPRMTVSVTLYLLSDLEVVPRAVLLPPGPLAKPFERRIYVTRNGGKPLKITEAAASVEGVAVEVSEEQPGVKFRLRARFPAGFMAPEGKATQLTFKTDDPSIPLVAIAVTQSRKSP